MKKIFRSIKNILLEIRDFPKSLYLNIRCLPINEAVYMPIRVKWNTRLGSLERNSITIKSGKIKRKMIELGDKGSQFVPTTDSYLSISTGGTICFDGQAILAEGFRISVEGGRLTIGDGFYSNRNLQIECQNSIKIGQKNLFGWNVSIRDTDGHQIIMNGNRKAITAPIDIGDHNWIASDATILKGTMISNGSIVACQSLVCGSNFAFDNCLIAGIPAKIKSDNIDWEN